MNERGFAPIIIVIIVVVIATVGSMAYLSQRGEDNDGADGSSSFGDDVDKSDLKPETEAGSFTGTVTGLLKQGKNLTCTIVNSEEGRSVSGTVFVANQGERIRGDFLLDQPDDTKMNGHIVRDNGYNYFWSEQLGQGTKTPITEDDDLIESESNNQDEVLDDSFEYKCDPWSVDEAVFDLPGDVEFVDLTAQIKQIDAGTQQVTDAQCAACEQVEEPGRSQCLAALGC